jgi:hypothetical protein
LVKYSFDLEYTPPDFTRPAFVNAPDKETEPAHADGLAPTAFYSSTNFPTYIKRDGQWLLAKKPRMDAVIVWDDKAGEFICTEMRKIRAGQLVVTGTAEDGSTGLLAYHTGFRPAGEEAGSEAFSFMASGASRERPINYRRIAELIAYVGAVFGGNAVAVHDLERALYGTALGMDIEGHTVVGGHRHHMDAINTVRRAGSIAGAVQSGIIPDGIMHALVNYGVPFILAGSIRDDGPLPGVLTDVLEAQDKMRFFTQGTTLVVMLATMLHSIATGNMVPTYIDRAGKIEPVWTIAVDQDEMVIQKLVDRGTHQAFGIVRNADDFLDRVVGELKKIEAGG